MIDKAAIERQVAGELKDEAELLTTLEVPTYEGRTLQAQKVVTREHREGSTAYAITGTSGWTAGCSKEVYDLLTEGKPYILETKGFNTISGWVIDGQWYDRKSDQDFDRSFATMIAQYDAERRALLEENREQWKVRQDALPDWIRTRIESFHERSGDEFALNGWGYELVIAELAVMYFAVGDDILDKTALTVTDSEEISEYARREGTSGNQHSMAIALAKAHLKDPDKALGGTISAMSPLTGSPDYSKAK